MNTPRSCREGLKLLPVIDMERALHVLDGAVLVLRAIG